MSYETKKNEQGEVLVYPLEIPIYEGDSSELGRQATTALTSCLRHLAVVDAYVNDGLAEIDIPELEGTYKTCLQHYQQGSTQLITCIMSLVSIAELHGIDIMKEIYDAPWEV